MIDSLWPSFSPIIVNSLPAPASPSDPHWTAYLTAFITPILAFIAAVIAYGQWKTAHNKLMFELFDKRVKTYELFKEFWGEFARKGSIDLEMERIFLSSANESRWLFGKEISRYLNDEVWEKISQLHSVESILEGAPPGDEKIKNIEKKAELRRWLIDQLDVFEEKLEPYLFLGINHKPLEFKIPSKLKIKQH